MKRTITSTILSAAFAVMASAADTSFTNGSGDSWWEKSGNWSNGEPTNEGTVTISNGYNVKVGKDEDNHKYYGYTIIIEDGASLDFTWYDTKIWGSTITVGGANGLIFSANTWGNYSNQHTDAGHDQPLTLNLGSAGSVAYKAQFNSPVAANIKITGELTTEEGEYHVATRTLLDFAATQTADLSTLTGIATTFSGYELSAGNTALAATEENLGKYWLVYDNESKDLNVAYITGDRAAAIPEPATATLSLLALAGLAARRRRK